ncbi:MAG: cysteine hydrolase [Candidatus Methylomirabilota bacterium]|jgi:nicotinamidase-related amidase
MNGTALKQLLISVCGLAMAACLAVAGTPLSSAAQTIVDEWNTVKAPPAPELKSVTIDPKVTALLILDIQKQNCNMERRPRCVASVPKIQGLLARTRAKGVSVIYSLGAGTAADIYQEVAPLGGEPVVTSGPDKFLGTDLEEILKERRITTVIVTGTAAHGAVIYTASGAALRGFKVIVPVEGMSAENTYAEQYTAWHLVNAPRVGAQVTLTGMDMIQYP